MQEEEHNQRFRQLNVEYSIHFVHFIHTYMNPLHVMNAKLMKQIKDTGNSQKLKIFLLDCFKHSPIFNSIQRWGSRAEDKGRGLRVEENKYPFLKTPLDGCFRKIQARVT